MRHRVLGKQLSRNTSHRKALRRNMASSLIQHGAIRTTEAKAKELRPFVEKLITIAREGTLHARRRVIKILQDREIFSYDEAEKDFVAENKTVVQKLFDEVAPRYVDRPGGYTRIIRLADRRIGDGGVQVILQLIDDASEMVEERVGGRRKKRAEKRRVAADQIQGEKIVEEETPDEEAAEANDSAQEIDQAETPPEESEEETSENGDEEKTDPAE